MWSNVRIFKGTSMNMLSSLKFWYISSFNLFFLFSFESYSCEEEKKLPPSAFQLPSSSTSCNSNGILKAWHHCLYGISASFLPFLILPVQVQLRPWKYELLYTSDFNNIKKYIICLKNFESLTWCTDLRLNVSKCRVSSVWLSKQQA